MFLTGTMRFNEQGHLEIGGCDTVELVKEFGTPLYVMDEELIRKNCAEYRDTFKRIYPNSQVVYAGKAFLTTAMCRLVDEEDMGLDVTSGGEIFTALQAGFPAQKMIFHGNNKSPEEIKMALAHGVGRFVVDSFAELDLLEETAGAVGKRADIYLRIKPGVEAHTHHYIQTGQLDSKFGLGLSDGQAMTAVKIVAKLKNVELRGIHCHIGSQIFDLKPFQLAASVMMDFIAEIKKKTGTVIKELDLGGGFGIRYLEEDSPYSLAEFVEMIAATVKEKATELGLPLPKLFVEPGRSIVGEAGTTLYTVGSEKNVPGIRKYVSVDGGMMDNLRTALYEAKYAAVVANRKDKEPTEVVSIAGKACESGDMLIWDITLPVLQRGDILAVLSTGAYHYSMANNYNRFPRPPVVFVGNGKADVVVARESYEDIVRNDIIPARLRNSGVREAAN
ncbi:MAG: diaminopimelate decarboxylase [Clostridiales bacterium]|jgi:diaminopimelate decarboxylase|nr:diaminopimelate decarboxylase [Clostridiales bacterium]